MNKFRICSCICILIFWEKKFILKIFNKYDKYKYKCDKYYKWILDDIIVKKNVTFLFIW